MKDKFWFQFDLYKVPIFPPYTSSAIYWRLVTRPLLEWNVLMTWLSKTGKIWQLLY